jgi:high-affinity iron transporter
MLETLLITFREGLEAFLIVAVTMAYLIKTDRSHLLKSVYAGIATAVLISLTTAWHIAELAQDPFMEGILAMTAGVLVATLTIVLIKGAKNITSKMTETLEKHAKKTGIAAFVGVFIFTVLMVAREGMETAMMIGAISSEFKDGDILVGAILGLSCVGIIGRIWITQSHRINIRLFMQATAIFLIIFCVHLFSYGFHELTEGNALPLIDNHYWHVLTEPLEPSEPVGKFITFLSLAIPLLWICAPYIKKRAKTLAF